MQRLSPTDEGYPESLRTLFGALSPPDIWYAGNLDLLKERSVGFCGSRSATPAGIQAATDCAQQLAEHQVAVVSGYAPGVDMASHEAALASGGGTIVVLAEGIDNFRVKKAIKHVWDWKRTLVISYFDRDAIWRVDRAMDRNKVIVGLSSAVIVVEARDKGGTLNAGYCALKMHKPLFVTLFEQMNDGREGNKRLLEEGAIPLRKNRNSGQAEIRHILDAVNGSFANSN